MALSYSNTLAYSRNSNSDIKFQHATDVREILDH
jgi:hypothetical protein